MGLFSWNISRDTYRSWNRSAYGSTGTGPRIVADPAVRFGRPTIQGTRVPVELVLAKLSGGMTAAEVAHEYDLTGADILAALVYAAHVLANDHVSYSATDALTQSRRAAEKT